MFDFSQVLGRVGDLLSGTPVAEALNPADIASMITERGIDLSALQGIDPSQAMEILQSAGIDVGALGDGPMAEALQSLGVDFTGEATGSGDEL